MLPIQVLTHPVFRQVCNSMAIADPHSLRKCAILISSVDADVARQMLMQLPTETAQQVRRLVARLDDVEPAERQAIIREFRQAALAGGVAPDAFSKSQRPRTASSPEAPPKEGEVLQLPRGLSSGTPSESPWQACDVASVVDALADERPQVMAVVLGQLESSVAAAVLGQLGPHLGCDVLKALSTLGEIEDSVRQTINQQVLSKLERHRRKAPRPRNPGQRVEMLLEAASDELRASWQAALSGQVVNATDGNRATERIDEQADLPAGAGEDLTPTVSLNQRTERERSAKQRVCDLDDLLALPRELLAQVMNGCDSETVLLALAGASPQFIERFYGMLQPQDARELDRRLKSIGGLKLSDIDQAQIRLVEAAEQQMLGQRMSA